jgi:hypothetical protein
MTRRRATGVGVQVIMANRTVRQSMATDSSACGINRSSLPRRWSRRIAWAVRGRRHGFPLVYADLPLATSQQPQLDYQLATAPGGRASGAIASPAGRRCAPPMKGAGHPAPVLLSAVDHRALDYSFRNRSAKLESAVAGAPEMDPSPQARGRIFPRARIEVVRFARE